MITLMRKYPKAPRTKGIAKVPVVINLESVECGAACLAMILAYYGKWVPLEQARLDCGVSRDGSKAGNVLRAARTYGLIAKGYRYEPATLMQKGKFPCVLHWNFNHFVVLRGFKNGKAYINCPTKGRFSVSMEEFDRAFTGVCMMFEPGPDFIPEGKPKSLIAFARKELKGAGEAFALMVVTTLIGALTQILYPGFARVFVDKLLSGEKSEWITPFVLLFGAVALAQTLALIVNAVYSLKANGKIAVVSNSNYMWHTLRLPVEFYNQRLAGDIAMRKKRNAEVAGTLIASFAPLVIQAATMIFFLVVMIRYSPVLALVGLACVAINEAIAFVISKKRVDITRVSARDMGKLRSSTVSGIQMIETIKASGAENGYFERWSGYQAAYNSNDVKLTKISAYWDSLPALVSALTNAIVLLMGVQLALSGKWTLGMITAFLGFLAAFVMPADKIIKAGQSIQEMRSSMEIIEDIMECPTDTHPGNSFEKPRKDLDKLSGGFEMRGVTFGYSRLDPPLIVDFNLTVEPGQRIALVGASGCGKSTLSKLISGLYKPWSGEILFDGKPISEIDPYVFRSCVSVVDQDIMLFEDSIENNIKMWDQSIENYEMVLASRDAQFHSTVMQREGGYQYRLAENGSDLSGGERQRLEIARVLAQEPTIVIMDEATSALDAKTEYDVVRSISDRGVTCIVIAHRMSTVRDCDIIMVLDHGRVVERGTHDELISKGGAYQSLLLSE